jgi:hypothetical protein
MDCNVIAREILSDNVFNTKDNSLSYTVGLCDTLEDADRFNTYCLFNTNNPTLGAECALAVNDGIFREAITNNSLKIEELPTYYRAKRPGGGNVDEWFPLSGNRPTISLPVTGKILINTAQTKSVYQDNQFVFIQIPGTNLRETNSNTIFDGGVRFVFIRYDVVYAFTLTSIYACSLNSLEFVKIFSTSMTNNERIKFVNVWKYNGVTYLAVNTEDPALNAYLYTLDNNTLTLIESFENVVAVAPDISGKFLIILQGDSVTLAGSLFILGYDVVQETEVLFDNFLMSNPRDILQLSKISNMWFPMFFDENNYQGFFYYLDTLYEFRSTPAPTYQKVPLNFRILVNPYLLISENRRTMGFETALTNQFFNVPAGEFSVRQITQNRDPEFGPLSIHITNGGVLLPSRNGSCLTAVFRPNLSIINFFYMIFDENKNRVGIMTINDNDFSPWFVGNKLGFPDSNNQIQSAHNLNREQFLRVPESTPFLNVSAQFRAQPYNMFINSDNEGWLYYDGNFEIRTKQSGELVWSLNSFDNITIPSVDQPEYVVVDSVPGSIGVSSSGMYMVVVTEDAFELKYLIYNNALFNRYSLEDGRFPNAIRAQEEFCFQNLQVDPADPNNIKFFDKRCTCLPSVDLAKRVYNESEISGPEFFDLTESLPCVMEDCVLATLVPENTNAYTYRRSVCNGRDVIVCNSVINANQSTLNITVDQNCGNETQINTCSATVSCPYGENQKCVDGFCRARCADQIDCVDGLECRDNACVPVESGMSTAVLIGIIFSVIVVIAIVVGVTVYKTRHSSKNK